MERTGVDPNSYPHSHSANDLSKTQDQLGNDGYENRPTAVANHTVPLGGAEEEEEGDEGVPSCLWDECGQKFPTLRKLVDHLSEWHIGWKKSAYTCQWNGCSRKGINQTSRFALISHLRGHTGERPFDCPVPECDKSFTRSDALAKHLKCQHANAPRHLLGQAASLLDGASPKKSRAKRRAPEQDKDHNDDEGEDAAFPENDHDDSHVSGGEGDGARGSDAEIDEMPLPDLLQRYRLLKAKHAYIRRETDGLSNAYVRMKKKLRRLRTEKEVLLDALVMSREEGGRNIWAEKSIEKEEKEGGIPLEADAVPY